MMAHRFDPSILREYDVRGIVGKTLNRDDAYALGRSFGSLASSEGARRIAVGRDMALLDPDRRAASALAGSEDGLQVARDGLFDSALVETA